MDSIKSQPANAFRYLTAFAADYGPLSQKERQNRMGHSPGLPLAAEARSIPGCSSIQ